MRRSILIMGLPGSGKSTLAELLAEKLNAVWFNADAVRQEINKDLGFSPEDRLEQARRMGKLCQWVAKTGQFAIADFICPTKETRKAFNADFTIWVDRIKKGRFEDTNKLFEPPQNPDIVLKEGTPEEWAEASYNKFMEEEGWNNKAQTALLVGRYQPFHDGHKALVKEAIKRSGQCCIALRDTAGTDESNPYDFELVKRNIRESCIEFGNKLKIIEIPNITDIFYGRGVGYNIEQINLSDELQDISATKIREGLIDKKGNQKPGWRPE